jgi:predicted transcriptional regulator
MTINPDRNFAKEIDDLKKLLTQIVGNKQGVYIENSYQMPNFITDFLDFYLTPTESKVLYRVVREILGWRHRVGDDKNVVAVTKILNGHRSVDGIDNCLGCGLGHETIQNALRNLCQYKILVKEQRTQKGIVYKLNFNTRDYDMPALIARLEKNQTKKQQQMIAARSENPKVKK